MALTLLLYHSVDRTGSLLSVTPEAFAAQMDAVRRSRREVITVAQAARRLKQGGPVDRAVCITFDDGYESVAENAWPILRDRDMTATVYFVTGMPGRRPDWLKRLFPDVFSPDTAKANAAMANVMNVAAIRDPAIARDPVAAFRISADLPIMTWETAQALMAEGMDPGGHTHTHPLLSRIGDAEKRHEIAGAKAELETRLHRTVETFAYPFGDHDADARRIVHEAGYGAAVTSKEGQNASAGLDPYALRRIGIWNSTSPARIAFYLSPLYRLYKAFRS